MPTDRCVPSFAFAVSAALAAFAAAAAAQRECAGTMAVRVPLDVQYGAAVACSGVSYQGGGVTLSTATGCPLFATITPEHHDAVISEKKTETVQVGSRPGMVAFFVCRTSYLIFIPWSSTCVFEREVALGVYPLLMTVACRDA